MNPTPLDLFGQPTATAKPVKNPRHDFTEVIADATTAFRTPGKDYFNPHYDSSPNSDAYAITTWCLYHTGNAPTHLAPSRGTTWKVSCRGLADFTCRVVNPHDHRIGVAMIPAK